MTRLQSALDTAQRRDLVRGLASAIVDAGRRANLDVVVVTADETVSSWAGGMGIAIIEDPDIGLDAAAAHAVDELGDGPWLLAHADLPAVTPTALAAVSVLAARHTVLVPSMDGGTNLIGHEGRFPFSFGDGSFHRHLASVPDAAVISNAALSIEVDTPAHLDALIASKLAPSLTSR